MGRIVEHEVVLPRHCNHAQHVSTESEWGDKSHILWISERLPEWRRCGTGKKSENISEIIETNLYLKFVFRPSARHKNMKIKWNSKNTELTKINVKMPDLLIWHHGIEHWAMFFLEKRTQSIAWARWAHPIMPDSRRFHCERRGYRRLFGSTKHYHRVASYYMSLSLCSNLGNYADWNWEIPGGHVFLIFSRSPVQYFWKKTSFCDVSRVK